MPRVFRCRSAFVRTSSSSSAHSLPHALSRTASSGLIFPQSAGTKHHRPVPDCGLAHARVPAPLSVKLTAEDHCFKQQRQPPTVPGWRAEKLRCDFARCRCVSSENRPQGLDAIRVRPLNDRLITERLAVALLRPPHPIEHAVTLDRLSVFVKDEPSHDEKKRGWKDLHLRAVRSATTLLPKTLSGVPRSQHPQGLSTRGDLRRLGLELKRHQKGFRNRRTCRHHCGRRSPCSGAFRLC